MSLAVFATGIILTWYITLQADITASVKQVSTLEAQLNTLKQDNDEAYNKP